MWAKPMHHVCFNVPLKAMLYYFRVRYYRDFVARSKYACDTKLLTGIQKFSYSDTFYVKLTMHGCRIVM